jgi:hypothetical protein
VEPDSTAKIHERALVEMQEREKILSGKKEKKRALAARALQLSLDRADAIIEGAPGAGFAPGAFDFFSIFLRHPLFSRFSFFPPRIPIPELQPSNS